MQIQEEIKKYSKPPEKTTTGYRQRFTFPSSFSGFDGHFPGNPLLPGVIQNLMGESACAEALKKEFPREHLRLESITRCKFLRPVRPEEEIVLEFSLKPKGIKHIGICSLSVKGETAATYQLIFSPEVK